MTVSRCVAIGLLAGTFCAVSVCSPVSRLRGAEPPQKAPFSDFKWVNPVPAGKYPGLKHATFKSPSMNVDVGYCIYLPPQYDDPKSQDRRFPVVYLLHGGRPGSEAKLASLAVNIDALIKAGEAPPAIYVFPNGGRVSHYNMPQYDSLGEDVTVKELIPHVDATYRTIARRSGRAIEGFSQGGRGTARIMFRYPELFCSAAPGGGGFATELRISQNDGEESPQLKFQPGHNAYDRAKAYADAGRQPPLPILIFVGDKGFNYENNLAYMEYLKSLKIEHQSLVVPGVGHDIKGIYKLRGPVLMQFHAENFRQAAAAEKAQNAPKP